MKGIRLSSGAAGPDALSRSRVDELVEAAKRWGAKGLAWMRVVPAPDEIDGGGEWPWTRAWPSSCRLPRAPG